MHLLSNNYLVNQTNDKGYNFTSSIPSYFNSTIQPETINNRLASQLINIDGSTALIKVPVGSKKPNNQSLHPFEHHPTTNTLNQQTLNITNNNQTRILHVTNMRPYTKHSKYKPRKPRTALVFFKMANPYWGVFWKPLVHACVHIANVSVKCLFTWKWTKQIIIKIAC